MNVLIIDGMGGGLGKAVIEHIAPMLHTKQATITAVGTNSAATSAMLKAGANIAATGENAVIYNAAKADYILGAIGIIATNAMHGEVTAKMAEAITASNAHKILIPVDKCSITVLGAKQSTLAEYLLEIIRYLK
ncbi:MAG: DUF3842 family protein [Defluviitaleaceae bacterium]|nr:DUF3842 family protein [Defluviitaleaceae bacterium]